MSQRRPDEVLRELLATLQGARLESALMGGATERGVRAALERALAKAGLH